LDVNPPLIGVVSSTTSVGLVLPIVLEMRHLLEASDEKPSFSDLLLGATAVSDMLSMFLLAFFVEGSLLSLDTAWLLLLMLVLYPSYRLIKVYSRLTEKVQALERSYHFSTRLSMVLMIIFAAMAEASGVHGVIGAFFAGVLISELLYSSEYLLRNLTSFGYSLFLPAFFLLTGVKVNLVNAILKTNLWLLSSLIILSLLGKVLGVAASARKSLGLRKAVIMGTFISLLLVRPLPKGRGYTRGGRREKFKYTETKAFWDVPVKEVECCNKYSPCLNERHGMGES